MSPRELELEQLLRWAVAETGPVPVPMGPDWDNPFPLKYPAWAEDARALLSGAPGMPIAEACAVLEAACTGRVDPPQAAAYPGADMLDLLTRVRDNPGRFSALERAAWRVFMREGSRMFAPRA